MGLCEICARIDLNDLNDEDDFPQDIPHHRSLESLAQSAPACGLCKLIYNAFEEKPAFKTLTQSIWADSPIILRGLPHQSNEFEETYAFYALKARCDRAGGLCTAYFGLYIDDETAGSEAGGVLADLIMGREIKPPEERFGLIRRWMDDCEQNHPSCSVQPSVLPTRVIDVGESEASDPRLLVTSGQKAHYVALSHCWGINPLIRTTTDTIDSHKRGLSMANLPKTFRDAVTIARTMGVRYLWIDSLCIVQDDPLDWERESVKMGFIYSSSFFTIAAAASKDSTGGCFLPRTRDHDVRLKCSVRGTSTISRVFVRPRPLDFNTLRQRHLHMRGWVMQERTLSCRMIHFDRDQLLWECRESRLAEDAVASDAESGPGTAWDERLHMVYPYKRYYTRYFIWDWYELVDAYSTKNFTKSEDKLPAISGVSQVMAQRFGEAYIAGLWMSHLAIGIQWRRSEKAWLTRPTAEYRAPSWSWAAWDGQVVMPQSAAYQPETVITVEVIDVKTTPSGIDPNGRLAGGFVKLSGRLKIADGRIDPASDRYDAISIAGSLNIDYLTHNGEREGWAYYDVAYDADSSGPLYCLELAHRPYLPHWWTALLLQPTGNENEYRRIGLGEGRLFDRILDFEDTDSGAKWFAGSEKVTITLI